MSKNKAQSAAEQIIAKSKEQILSARLTAIAGTIFEWCSGKIGDEISGGLFYDAIPVGASVKDAEAQKDAIIALAARLITERNEECTAHFMASVSESGLLVINTEALEEDGYVKSVFTNGDDVYSRTWSVENVGHN